MTRSLHFIVAYAQRRCVPWNVDSLCSQYCIVHTHQIGLIVANLCPNIRREGSTGATYSAHIHLNWATDFDGSTNQWIVVNSIQIEAEWQSYRSCKPSRIFYPIICFDCRKKNHKRQAFDETTNIFSHLPLMHVIDLVKPCFVWLTHLNFFNCLLNINHVPFKQWCWCLLCEYICDLRL